MSAMDNAMAEVDGLHMLLMHGLAPQGMNLLTLVCTGTTTGWVASFDCIGPDEGYPLQEWYEPEHAERLLYRGEGLLAEEAIMEAAGKVRAAIAIERAA